MGGWHEGVGRRIPLALTWPEGSVRPEDAEKEQEHIQDVEEDRRRHQWGRSDVLRASETLKVEHREDGEDDQVDEVGEDDENATP